MGNIRKILKDERGVEGLPVRLIVVLVVGVIALAAIVAMLGVVKPQKVMTASIISIDSDKGNSLMINATGGEEVTSDPFTAKVHVTDNKDGTPVSGASVVLHGLGTAGSGTTGGDGNATIEFKKGAKLAENQESGYFTLEGICAGYTNSKVENAIVVMRTSK